MKSKMAWTIGLILAFAANNAIASKAMQMWRCGLEDGVTEEEVVEGLTEWVAKVRKLDGGENIEGHVLFPIAVNAPDHTDMVLIVTMPTFAEWGRFWDVYPDSEAAANESDQIFCPDSTVWEAIAAE